MSTKIRWTDETWNPTVGCSVVSPGCENCYAERMALRFGWSKKPWKAQNAAENVQLKPERLQRPLHWKQPRRVFVDSMADLFHEQVPFEYIDQVFDVMEHCRTKGHTFQVLTKRPERMREYMTARAERIYPPEIVALSIHPEFSAGEMYAYIFPGIWLGVSVEDQRRADERIPILLDTPAAVRFLSCEPLLGPLSLEPWLWEIVTPKNGRRPYSSRLPGLSWVIVGGESGPRYRPMDLDWARSLRDQCLDADVAFYFKQSGGARTETGQELDGVRWEQMPEAGEKVIV